MLLAVAARVHRLAIVTEDRESLIAELQTHGTRLRAARDDERDELDAIAKLLPRAIAAGVSRHEIARLTGVGRPWINRKLVDD
jgi:hypothetical protein